jgi:hypothetical protein
VNIELIVCEIDAEIEKLQRIRGILKNLLAPKSQTVAKWRPARVKRLPVIDVQPVPRLVVLPPRQRREYTRRVKPVVIEANALVRPVSSRPVFVPKAAVAGSQPAKTAVHRSAGLEAVMRRKLLGGAA